MSFSIHETATYKVIGDSGGRRYRFFCDVSGMAVCTTRPIQGETPEEELLAAWESEAREQFNYCNKCGRWVSDAMYNADVLQCVDCAPWENKPRFCHRCGIDVALADTFCRKCGAKLQYGEVSRDDSGTV